MSPGVGAPYRLELARRSLASARDNFDRHNWRDSALFARAAAEHAAKAMAACFIAVPGVHEPARLVELAACVETFPPTLLERSRDLLPELAGLGLREHLLLSYGDEERGIDPWALVDVARAESHLRSAAALFAIAESCVALVWEQQDEP